MIAQRLGRLVKLVVGLASLMVLTGCSHLLEVKNFRPYRNLELRPLSQRCTIGIIPDTEDTEGRQLVKSVGNALATESATVLLPYLPSGDRKADVVARIAVSPKFEGSGWNFLINWPGFLIWTPAWNGYVYKADLSTTVTLVRPADNSTIDSWRIPIKLDLRQAEFDRTWTEIGWLEVGIIPLIGGFCFVQYDPDVTVPLMDKVERPLGEYIARQIIDRLNRAGVAPQ